MKQRTRLFSIFLALVMCLSLLPGTALAAGGKLLLVKVEAFGSALGWECEVTDVASYTVKLLVDYPDGYSYSETWPFTVQHYAFTWTGEGLPSVDTDPVESDITTPAPDWNVTPSNPQYPGYTFTPGNTDEYTITDSSRDGQSRGRATMAEEQASPDFDAYAYFTPLDPADVLDHDFSSQPFTGWLCEETGEIIHAGQERKADRDMTLIAQWEQAQPLRVDFDANGGKITSIRGVPAAQLVPGSAKAAETETFVDTNSGIGMMMTGADHKLDSFPAAERGGYVLDGWYTLKEGGNQVTTDTVLAGECTLYAHWTQTKGEDCTVTYDWNGASFLQPLEPQTVAYGGQAPLYTLNADIGHTLKGWAMEDGVLWDNRAMRVTEDMTLYAVWDPAFTDEDDFSFNNSDQYFDNYNVSGQYLKYLVRNETPYYQNYIRNYSRDAKWRGSCFGMSAVYVMQKGGALDVGVFQSGAKGLRDLAAPNQSNNVRDLVNFYMLAQMTAPAYYYKEDYLSETDLSKRYSRVLADVQNSDGYSLLGFNYAGGGHAVVAKSASNGRVAIWDPNYPGVDITLTISGSTARFSGPSGLSDTFAAYNTHTELKYVMPLETRSQNYDASNLQSVFKSGADAGAASTQSSRVTLTSTVGDFTVASSGGETATVKGGEPSGSLAMRRVYIDGAEDPVYRYELNTNDAQSLTVTLSSADAEIQVVTGGVYALVTAPKLNTVTVSDGAVATSAASAGQQTITMVSEKLDGAWNKVTVTGRDTGFKVGAAEGQLTVASDNNAAVTVTGENADTWEEGEPQTVTAAHEGTVLTTAQLSGGSVQPTAAFPFTDVEENRWFRPAVEAAYNAGLVKGLTDTAYGPQNTLTLAEAVTLAARMYAETHEETVPSGGSPWYKAAYDYCVEKGIIDGADFALARMTQTATRFEMVAILDGAIPAQRMDSSVTVERIPDLAENDAYGEVVYRWYRAGILTGNADGSFAGERSITRAEVAQILCTINRLS